MKYLLPICVGSLFLCALNMPIGYYTFVRIIVTIVAVFIVVNERCEEINFWQISFSIVAILFNPIFPIYLHNRIIWLLLDFIVAILFIIKILLLKSKNYE